MVNNQVGTMTPTATALAAINAVETRDLGRLHELYDPHVTFEWPPGLPYSGRFEGGEIAEMTERFQAVWGPLQPTTVERSMEPVVIGSSDDTVVIEYHWRATHPTAGRFETRVLARYRVQAGRLLEARMFYWDHAGLLRFLDASRGTIEQKPASSDPTE